MGILQQLGNPVSDSGPQKIVSIQQVAPAVVAIRAAEIQQEFSLWIM